MSARFASAVLACSVAAAAAALDKPCVDGGHPLFDSRGAPTHTRPRDAAAAASTPSGVVRSYSFGFGGAGADAALAAQMARRAAGSATAPDMVWNVGGSFGLRDDDGTEKDADRWRSAFETTFADAALQDAYFYSVLGRRDWNGGAGTSNVSGGGGGGAAARINYTIASSAEAPEATNRWCMPDANYSFFARAPAHQNSRGGGSSVGFFAIDTTSLLLVPSTSGCGNGTSPTSLSSPSSSSGCMSGTPPPYYATPQAQLEWLEAQVCGARSAATASTDRFLAVVVGHRPLVSASLHSIDASLAHMLLPVFDRCGVDVYLAADSAGGGGTAARYTYPGQQEPNGTAAVLDHNVTTLHHFAFSADPVAASNYSLPACGGAQPCAATETAFKQAWGDAWDLLYHTRDGAFLDLRTSPVEFTARALNAAGVAAHLVTYDAADGVAKPDPGEGGVLAGDEWDGVSVVVWMLVGVLGAVTMCCVCFCSRASPSEDGEEEGEAEEAEEANGCADPEC